MYVGLKVKRFKNQDNKVYYKHNNYTSFKIDKYQWGNFPDMLKGG